MVVMMTADILQSIPGDLRNPCVWVQVFQISGASTVHSGCRVC